MVEAVEDIALVVHMAVVVLGLEVEYRMRCRNGRLDHFVCHNCRKKRRLGLLEEVLPMPGSCVHNWCRRRFLGQLLYGKLGRCGVVVEQVLPQAVHSMLNHNVCRMLLPVELLHYNEDRCLCLWEVPLVFRTPSKTFCR